MECLILQHNRKRSASLVEKRSFFSALIIKGFRAYGDENSVGHLDYVGRAHRSHRWGKREKRQPGGLSCEAGSESSLLARKEERSPPQGLRATIERTDVGSSPTVTTEKPIQQRMGFFVILQFGIL